jgi:hypothetical protein
MSFRTMGSVEEQPSVDLMFWRFFEVDGDTCHFVGADSDFAGRVSSVVVEFDLLTMRGVTQSGQVYELQSNPGDSEQADYVWDSGAQDMESARSRTRHGLWSVTPDEHSPTANLADCTWMA